MFGISKLTALILAFTLGFAVGAGALLGGVAITLATFTVRDLERKGIPIPDESFMGTDYEVDLLDLNVFEFLGEMKNLGAQGDGLTINYLQKRYDLILHEKLNALLTDQARNMPIKSLLGKEGITMVLGSIYIGTVEKYDCYIDDENGTPVPCDDPSLKASYWMNNGSKISPLEELIADWTLADFMAGNINTGIFMNKLRIGEILGYHELDGVWYDSNNNEVTGITRVFAGKYMNNIGSSLTDLKIGEVFGYTEYSAGKWENPNQLDSNGDPMKVTGVMAFLANCNINEVGSKVEGAKLGLLLGYEEENGGWYNNGTKVTGAMAVFADSNIDGVSNVINTTKLGKLLGYETDDENVWYTLDGNGTRQPVSGFMNKVASRTIDQVDGVFDSLTVGDIVPEDKRVGFIGMLPPNTELNNISSEVNTIFNTTKMRTFVENDIIIFENTSEKEKFLASPFANYNISELLSAVAKLPSISN